jgi:ABC-type transporter Mla maintaining outer membrane lipid asymmetry ATPase subunit MlaF
MTGPRDQGASGAPAVDAFRLDAVTFLGEKGRVVLDALSLSAKPGSATALVGHVGGGKTTVLRLLAGLVAPASGKVSVFGIDPATLSYEELRAHRMRVGYAFEWTGLLGNMTLGENIALPLSYHGDGDETEARTANKVRELAEELEIDRHLDEYPAHANGSIKKRALSARALALEPKLLLCDEPQVGLTPRQARVVSAAIERRRRSRGLTVVIADHDGYIDPFVVTRTFYLENGRTRTAPSIHPPQERDESLRSDRVSLTPDIIYRGT